MKNTKEKTAMVEFESAETVWRPPEGWLELTGGKDEMQKIVSLLVDFDEKTGRVNRYRDQASHWMRKAVAVCDPNDLRLYVKHSLDWAYCVAAHIVSRAGVVKTTWVHEDGIRAERATAPAEHAVHSIVCLSDLVQKFGRPADPSVIAELDELP